MDELIERLRYEADISARPGQMDRLNELADEFAAALAAAREDARRLMYLATDGCVEGFIGVEKDIYAYACDVAGESGRYVVREEDMLGGIRRLVDAAIAERRLI